MNEAALIPCTRKKGHISIFGKFFHTINVLYYDLPNQTLLDLYISQSCQKVNQSILSQGDGLRMSKKSVWQVQIRSYFMYNVKFLHKKRHLSNDYLLWYPPGTLHNMHWILIRRIRESFPRDSFHSLQFTSLSGMNICFNFHLVHCTICTGS